MLGSMTPLGERARSSRWTVTVGYFVLGSALGGLALGALLGAAGTLLPFSASASAIVLLLLVLVGGLVDGGVLGPRLPTVRRQVDDSWLHRYRSWVYGLGFGFQLGLGVVTVVGTSAVYVTFAASVLARSPVGGGVIGLLFGLARSLPILSVAGVTSADRLFPLHARLERSAPVSRRWASALQVGIGGLGCLTLLGLHVGG